MSGRCLSAIELVSQILFLSMVLLPIGRVPTETMNEGLSVILEESTQTPSVWGTDKNLFQLGVGGNTAPDPSPNPLITQKKQVVVAYGPLFLSRVPSPMGLHSSLVPCRARRIGQVRREQNGAAPEIHELAS